MTVVDAVRGFNRFYTRRLGLLGRHLPESDFTLPEARVMYELATGGERTAAELGRELGLDKAHLSRIVSRLEGRGLLARRVSPAHGKHLPISLTDAGRAAFAGLEREARAQVEAMLQPLGPGARERLAAAMAEIAAALSADAAPDVRLRRPEPGDLGWIAHRQATLYTREYGWDWTFEGLLCEILGRFVTEFDPARDDAWVAEKGGGIVGSVFLVKSDDPAVAKLRMLYVEPAARGAGVGKRLVAAAIDRARELGYREMTLWTNDILLAARRIYEGFGFRLVAEERHRSFGHDLVGQTWTLVL